MSYGTSSSRKRHDHARRRKALNGHTPYEYICKIWTSEPDRFILDPIHQMPGLNNQEIGARQRIAQPG